ncbi:MAG: glycoside hydrolase family 2 TIM barrel-domain containing protein [Candidatus Margulisiibacteriota bacterium]
MRTISLRGKWQYILDPKESGEKSRLFDPSKKFKSSKKMNIPSNWQVGGIDNYSGTVWFKKEFDGIDIKDGEDAILQFAGVDYFAKVWLNGKLLGEHEGYFQPFEFDVTKFLNTSPLPMGEGVGVRANVLVVKVSSPAEPAGKDAWPHRKRLIKGVFGHHDVRPGAWHGKLGQSKGTGGIWNDVNLIICKKIRLSGIKINPKLKDNYKTADLNIEIFAENTTSFSKKAVAIVEIIGPNGKNVDRFKSMLELRSGINIFDVKTVIKGPHLWWPRDLGEQNLYYAKVSLFDAKSGELLSLTESRFGIREIKIGENKAWIINGKKIFVRGSNIIPEEYLSAYSKERIKKDVELIKESNCNAVRVHAHVNRKELYDALDEAGIMVWQDFALQWEYIDTPQFISEAVKQIREMVNLLHNNPCVVVWCCHNEPVAKAKKLDDLLFKAVGQEDTTRAIFKSSDFHEHPYPGWFWGHYRYFLSLVGKPFPSEFGAQALPREATLKKMFAKKDLWPPNWFAWAYRDFVYEQTFHIAGVEQGRTLKEFIRNSQDYQSRVIKFSVENYRQHKWSQITGIFHFMLLEPWPAVSYSVTDYFRNRKKGFFALKKSFQPVAVLSSLQRSAYGIGRKIEGQFWIVNDYPRDFRNAKIVFSLKRKNRALHRFAAVTIDVESDSCKEVTNKVYSYTKGLEIPLKIRSGPAELFADVFDSKGKLISSNSEEIDLVRIPKGTELFNAEFLWE